jgi:hypothetical protein
LNEQSDENNDCGIPVSAKCTGPMENGRPASEAEGMSTTGAALHDLTLSTAAQRMRRYRKRRHRGMRYVRVQVHETEVDILVLKRYLDQQSRGELKSVEYAVRSLLLDALSDRA